MPCPLAHAHDAVGLRRLEDLRLGPATVVFHRQVQPTFAFHDVHIHRAGAGVSPHVAEHLLKNAENRHGHRLGQDALRVKVHAPLELLLGRLDKLLRLPRQGVPQTLVVQDAGAQVGDDAAHIDHRVLDQAAHVLALAPHLLAHGLRLNGRPLLLLGQALVKPAHIHLERHQQAAQLVVHLAGDAGALFFAHRLGPSGQLAQLLQGRFERLGAFRHALLQLGLGLVQGILGLLALGDVHKGHHRTTHLALVEHRVAGILHREAAAARAPEHLAVDAAGLALAKGVVDRAFVQWVVRSVAM